MAPVIYHRAHTEPPKTRSFLALCDTSRHYSYEGMPVRFHGRPVWREIHWIDGRFSEFTGFDREWTTRDWSFTHWMESPCVLP